MKLNVRGLRESPGRRLEAPLAVSFRPQDLRDDVAGQPEPLSGTVEAIGTGDGILVRVKAAGRVDLQCARCLTPFAHALRLDVTEEFLPGPGHDADPDSGADDTRTYADDVIDLTDPIRQEILLELPMKPLCHPECKGLCPTCGVNRNHEACTCENREPDPRLSGLQEWLDRHSRS